MAPGGWATAAQSLHLRSDLAKYCKFADMGKFERFWTEMENAWFAKWPEEDVLNLPRMNTPEGRQLTGEQLVIIGTATKKRVKQLKSVYRYARSKLRKVSRKIDPVSMGAMLFRKKAKRSRKLQVIEVYQKQNKEGISRRLRAKGYDRLNEEGMAKEGGGETNTKRMKMRREVVAEMWGAESEARRQFYRDEAAKQRKKGCEEVAVGEGNDDVRRRPEELQASIQELEGVLKMVHDAIEQKTGWKGMTVVGGPMPEKGGDLVVEAYCFGVSAAGRNLSQGHPRWTEGVVDPAFQWLRQCFPRSDRVKWALTTEENDMGDIDTGGDSGSGDSGGSSDSDSDTGASDDSTAPTKKKGKKPPQRRPRPKVPAVQKKGKGAARPLEGEEEDLFGDRLLGAVDNGNLAPELSPPYSAVQVQAPLQAQSGSSLSAPNALETVGRLTGLPFFDLEAAPYSFDNMSFGGDGDFLSFGLPMSNGSTGPGSATSSGLLGLSAAFSNGSGLSEGSLGGFEQEFGDLDGADAAPPSTPPAQPSADANGLDSPMLRARRLLAAAEARGLESGAILTFHRGGRTSAAPAGVPSFDPRGGTSWTAGVALAALGRSPGRGDEGEGHADGGRQAVGVAKLVEDAGKGTMDGHAGRGEAPAPVPTLPALYVGLEDARRKAERAADAAAFDEAWKLALMDGAEGDGDPPQSRPQCNPPKAAKPVKKKAGKAVGGKKAARGGKKKAKEVDAEEGGGRGEGGEKSTELSASGSRGKAREELDGQEVMLTAVEKRKATMARKRGEKEEAGVAGVETGATGEDGTGEEGDGRRRRTVRPPANAEGERVEYREVKRKRAPEVEEGGKGSKRRVLGETAVYGADELDGRART
ncbi:hypothetical protein C8J57DRAFT_1499313 [Mycena rebaudengoi]|nr:hypothetical protein C8J57DRAFT_1499313 [Mycena rebaudengoi]